MALILSVRPGERVVIEGGIVVEVLVPTDKGPRLAITAPRDIGIWREAVCPREHLPTSAPRTPAKA